MANKRNLAGLGVKARILFTGSGIRVIENLMEHISYEYEADKCPARDDEFMKYLKHYAPHVVVICLQNENRNGLKAYSILDNSEYTNIPVIVIGHDEECESFKKMVVMKKTVILGRPINMDLFLDTLDGMAGDAVYAEQSLAEPAVKSAISAVKEAESQNTSASGEKKSILVVDDDTTMLNTLKLYLQDMYDVTVVPSGKLALKFLSKKHADLVLLDYLMPEMDGPKVLDQIRTASPEPDVPVLFLTGVNDKDMVMKTLEQKPNGYLLKPATRETLLERVMEILLGL